MKLRLGFLLRFYLLTLLLFAVAKVVFMLSNHEGHAFTAADVWQVLRHGLSLDLSTALYFLIFPFLLCIVSVWMWLKRWVMRAYYAIIALALALAFTADTSLYRFWGFKLDASFLQYLDTPSGITQSVSTGYLLGRLLAVLLVALVIYRCYAGLRDFFPLRRSLGETLVYLLLSPLFIVGIRGGVTESTTNIGQAYFSQEQFFNHAAVNPVFSFLYSLSHQMGDTSQYQFFDQDRCDSLTAGVYTTESIRPDTLLTTPRPNIVVILLESAGEQFAEVMPRLQQLKRQGVCFSRCYANSWRTDRGTVSTLSGYPSFPSVSVMKMPEKSRSLPSLARTLQAQGYQTSYLYGGDINFTNMRSYLIATGWQTLTSMDDYSASERRTAKWGVRDDITFSTLLHQIAGFQPRTSHLIGFSTLSSHEPWDVPVSKLDDPVLNAFAYLDQCLGQFVDSLRQTPQWNNLLVVVTADHGINHLDVDQSRPLAKNHIPMLWLGGAVRRPCVVDRLCNQSDLCATLLGQLHLSHTDFAFSRDVLSQSYTYPTAVNNYSNAQMLADSTGHVVYDFDAQCLTVSQSADAERLTTLCKAILQKTTNDLSRR